MAAPDLKSPEGLRIYRAELKRVARGWRWVGLPVATLAAIGFVLRARWNLAWSSPIGLATIAGLVVGWGVLIATIVKRTRYHKARMKGWPGDA